MFRHFLKDTLIFIWFLPVFWHLEKLSNFYLHFHNHCGIILILGGQCSWIVKILLVRVDLMDLISWVHVTGLLHYNAKAIFTALLKVRGNVNSWVKLIHIIHEHYPPSPHNDYSTVLKQQLKCINVLIERHLFLANWIFKLYM